MYLNKYTRMCGVCFSGSTLKLKSSGFLAGSGGINQLKNNFQLSESLHELDFPGDVFDI